MKDLQTVLDALEYAKHDELTWEQINKAVAIVKQMMQAEPVAFLDKYGDVFSEVEKLLPTDTPLYTHAAPQAVPAGFVLVPVEPTQEQLKAATACSAKVAIPSGKDYYRAMLAAAPKDYL